MLYPVQNNFRSIVDLSGIWSFIADPLKIGERKKWFRGFDSDISIAVPGSWNEQLEELGLLFYVGSAWYSRSIFIPKEYQNKRILLRAGSIDYNSKIWIDGKLVGESCIGFLPFELEITDYVIPGKESKLIIMVNNELNHETIPQGITSGQYVKENRLREETNPPARFDFSPYGGIHRTIQIIATPVNYISKIKADTKIVNKTYGKVIVNVAAPKCDGFSVSVQVKSGNSFITDSSKISNGIAALKIQIPECRLWSQKDPFLYDMKVQLNDSGKIIDEYALPVGIREIKISGNKLLLNGEEVYLKGFGKHEDFSVIGKGLFLPLMVKDFELMKWINANSFRTSHYPYSEEMMSYADKKGILVIDEVAAVSLDTRYANENTLKTHKEHITRLIERDYNHPSVIMWALGNEPNLVGASEYYNGSGRKYWKAVFEHANKIDPARPKTVPNCLRAGVNDPVFEFSDVLSMNRYYGWYEYPGNLDIASKMLSGEMDKIYNKYKKPLLFTEFGSDTVSGFHSTSLQMFTEEYQTNLLEAYIKVIRSKKYTIGEHVWNFADFKTPQHFRRVVLNLKGVFTRTREPKSAAFFLKKLWQDSTIKKK